MQSWMVNMIPWLSLLPCTYLGKILSEQLIKDGYSVTSTRKIVETICLATQSINLLILGKLKAYLFLLKIII